MPESITKTYTVTITGKEQAGVARRIDRLMAWLHTSSSWGHSGIVAMSLDGDGWEKVRVDGIAEESVEWLRRQNGRSHEYRVEYMHQND